MSECVRAPCRDRMSLPNRCPPRISRAAREEPPGPAAMNVIVFASRKGGSGKSTLTAHLAAQASTSVRRCLLIDGDSQGSLTLWHRLRRAGDIGLRNGTRDLTETVIAARQEGWHWAFIDTPPNMSQVV